MGIRIGKSIPAWLVVAALAGSGGCGQNKGEGGGDGVRNRVIPRAGGESGPITRDDTNAGVSGTGRGDPASSVSGPRNASDINSGVTK